MGGAGLSVTMSCGPSPSGRPSPSSSSFYYCPLSHSYCTVLFVLHSIMSGITIYSMVHASST